MMWGKVMMVLMVEDATDNCVFVVKCLVSILFCPVVSNIIFINIIK